MPLYERIVDCSPNGKHVCLVYFWKEEEEEEEEEEEKEEEEE